MSGPQPLVSFRPGPSLVGVAVALPVLGGVAFFWAEAIVLLAPLAIFAIGGGIAEAWELRSELRGLTLRREAPERWARGLGHAVRLRIKSGARRTLHGEVREILPESAQPADLREPLTIPHGGEAVLTYEVAFPQRGDYVLGPAWVRLRGRFGLLERHGVLEVTTPISVLPESAVAHGQLEKRALDETLLLLRESKTRLRGPGLEFESLAEFQPGEDPRRVDWRASARSRRLVVRRFQVEQHRDVMVLLDTGRLMGADAGRGTKLDRAVDSALMLCRVAFAKGDRCGVALFDSELRGYLPPSAGAGAYDRVLRALAPVQSRWTESNFANLFATLQSRLKKRALVIVLSDLADEDSSYSYRSALASLAQRHLVVFVAVQTPQLNALWRQPVTELRDVSRKAVLVRLQRRRAQVLDRMKHSGLEILDLEPEQLTVPLINEYIRIRQGNFL